MAPRDDDKLMAGMLRRTLAHPSVRETAAGGNDCPPADILAAYYERSLGEDESTRYDLHFSNCAICREQLAAMVRAEETAQPKANWGWLWNPYLLAPAVAVLALAVFFGVHRSAQTTTINQQLNAPLVAMSRADQLSPQNEAAPAPPAPIEPPQNATSGQLKSGLPESSERDSLPKTKQLTPSSPAPPSAPVAAAESLPLSGKKTQDLPLNGRNLVQLVPLEKSGNAPRSETAPASPAPTLADKKELQPSMKNTDELQKSADAASAAQNAVVSQSVEVTAAAPSPQSAQNEASSRRAPALSASSSGGAAATASSGNIANNSATAETVNRGQTQAPAAMSRFAGIAKSPSPQMVAGASAQKIFQTPNTKVLWRSADGGFVERSPDGGATWEGQPLPGISGEIAAGSSPAPKICWLVGSGGSIFMTKDGSNWKKIAPPVSVDFTAVTANDASNAAITAADGRKFQTTDGGKHWKTLP
jgi:hypothetical protein